MDSVGRRTDAESGDGVRAGEGAAPRRGRSGTFRTLRHRDFRYLWLGQIGHAASLWMEQVVRPLLTLYLTGSPFQVGLVVAVRLAPVLVFGLLAGVVADRYNKRRVLMYCQAVTLLMHALLGALIVGGLIETWHVYATAVVSGAAMAFNQPARQSILPRLVPREDLLNALALNQAAISSMRVAGAGLAGVLLVFFDFGEVYLLNAAIYAAVIWTTVRMNIPADPPSARKRGSWRRDLFDGFRYVGSQPAILRLVLIALILFIFGMPYQQVFVPLLAIDVWQVGRSGVGWMLALTGVGAVAGSLVMATRDQIRRRRTVMSGALAVFSLALVVLANSGTLVLAAAALVVAGSMSVTYLALNNALLLEQTPPELHGRVMSLMTLDRGLIPIGAIIAGALAEAVGPGPGLTIMAGVCLGLTVVTVLAGAPPWRRREPQGRPTEDDVLHGRRTSPEERERGVEAP